MSDQPYQIEPPRCGFCGKDSEQAEFLLVGYVAGKDSYICNECCVLAGDFMIHEAPVLRLQREVRKFGT